MTKEEIIRLYIGDLESKVPQSDARDNRIKQLETELQNTPSNSDYAKLPKLSDIVEELEKTGWLHPEYKGIAIEENRYNGIEVVLTVIKKLGNFA